MKKYLVIMRSEPRTPPQQPPSPAQMQEIYAAFTAWKEKFKANVVDIGDGLKPDGRVLRADGITDGPFVEVKEIAGGFMILAAQSYDEAVEVARESPGMKWPGSSLEIRELMGRS